MRTIEEVEKHLRSLHLHGMAQTLQARCLQAQQNGSMSVLDVLTELVQDELDCRQSRLIERRFHSSGLDERKMMQDFDWSYNPRLPRQEILELISVKFVQSAADALLIGHPGTGKSHISKAVAHAAIQAGYQVAYREAQCFFEDIFEATQTGKRKKLFKLFCGADLLVIDDLFLKKRLLQAAADDLLDVILERYRHRRSTMITSNRPIEDWGKLLGDNAAASAILDRLLHCGHLLKFEGKSYRLKEASKRLALEKKNN
ncbi:IS21-like element helper ATPase IstB [Syntrophus buswellii]|uniref:IS21-like element helper ATPase IstB n=1 Tax=Syntrophus buswellii TaxID=43774 RepID=UPI0038D4D7DE